MCGQESLLTQPLFSFLLLHLPLPDGSKYRSADWAEWLRLLCTAVGIYKHHSGAGGLQEACLRAMNCFTDALLMVDVSQSGWPLVHVNTAFEQRLGVKREEAVAASFWHLFQSATCREVCPRPRHLKQYFIVWTAACAVYGHVTCHASLWHGETALP